MITHADKAFYATEIAVAINKLNIHYGAWCSMPQVYWNLRGRSRLGYARGHDELHLNASYADALGREGYLQTVLHEACHNHTSWRRTFQAHLPRTSRGSWAPHGTQWAATMRFLGLHPHRCSPVPAEVSAQVRPARTVRKITAICGCVSGHEITVNMSNKIARGARYRCRLCGKTIILPGARVR